MRWIVLFNDAPEMMAHRRQFSAQHIEYARKHKAEILIGGGLKETENGDFVGGMWVCEVTDRQQLVSLVENDPYYHPIHRQYKLLMWGKILQDEMVTL